MANENTFDRIDDLLLKENYLLGLNFPDKGTVFFRINAREFIPYVYDEIGDLTADEWKDSARLGLAAKDITNILDINTCDEIYQVFMGISPSSLKSYLHYPVETIRGNLDEVNNYTKSDFGFVDGFESPFNDPSPLTEVFIPEGMKVGWAWHNPTNERIRSLLNLLVIRYKVSVVRDADLIHRIITGRKEARIATIGGVDKLAYNTRHTWDIDPIPFGSSLDEITDLIKMSRS